MYGYSELNHLESDLIWTFLRTNNLVPIRYSNYADFRYRILPTGTDVIAIPISEG